MPRIIKKCVQDSGYISVFYAEAAFIRVFFTFEEEKLIYLQKYPSPPPHWGVL